MIKLLKDALQAAGLEVIEDIGELSTREFRQALLDYALSSDENLKVVLGLETADQLFALPLNTGDCSLAQACAVTARVKRWLKETMQTIQSATTQ